MKGLGKKTAGALDWSGEQSTIWTGVVSRVQLGASLALCLEMPTAKLHPEVVQGNAGWKLGLIEGAGGLTALPRSTGTCQAELLSFLTGTRRRVQLKS